MSNLFDYLDWRGDISFEENEINKIDILLLSHLTYSIFDNLVSASFNEEKTLCKLVKEFKLLPDYEKRINIGYLINKQTVDLLIKCAKTTRFKNICVCGYKTIFDEKAVEQFAAVTYKINDKIIVCFRGTDDSFIGWKEDFYLSCLPEIPAQRDALDYLQRAAEYFNENIIVAGHSKGGNLAVYAAAGSLKIQNRIENVYNFDGPGFSKEFFNTKEFLSIENKVLSFYPYFSVVGMMFNHPKNFEIVDSDAFAFWQHDAISWQIKGKNFVNKKSFNDKSQFFNKAFNEWIEKLSFTQRKEFVESLFSLLQSSETFSINEFEERLIPSTAKIISAYAYMDKEEKKQIHEVLNLFKEVLHSDFPLFKLPG